VDGMRQLPPEHWKRICCVALCPAAPIPAVPIVWKCSGRPGGRPPLVSMRKATVKHRWRRQPRERGRKTPIRTQPRSRRHQ